MHSLETSFQGDIDTCETAALNTSGHYVSRKPFMTAYRLKEIGVVYQYAVHPAANEDSLMFISTFRIVRSTQSVHGKRQMNCNVINKNILAGRSIPGVYTSVISCLPSWADPLRYKPIIENIGCLCSTDCSCSGCIVK